MAGLFSSETTANQKRKNFRESLNAPQITTLPGAFNPVASRAFMFPVLCLLMTLDCQILA